MEAKLKAEYLLELFEYELIEQKKQYALKIVDEIINCDSFFKTLEDTKEFTKYWYEVQQEIEKI